MPITRSLRVLDLSGSGAGRRPAYRRRGLGPVIRATATSSIRSCRRSRAQLIWPLARHRRVQRRQPDVRVFGRRGRSRTAARPQRPGGRSGQHRARDAGRRSARGARVCSTGRCSRRSNAPAGTIGATLARQQFGLTGKGVGVAVIDSGITSWHDDLYSRLDHRVARVAHFKDFTSDDPGLWRRTRRTDDYGHGTHVAGIIAGTGYDSDGRHTGIAPGRAAGRPEGPRRRRPRLHQRRHRRDRLRDLGQGRPTTSASSTSRSPSGVFESYQLDPLTLAAQRAVEAGIVVVAVGRQPRRRTTSGEPQFGGITSPGQRAVGADRRRLSHQGTAAAATTRSRDFSSRGPTWIDFAAKPDLVAPGVGIESLTRSAQHALRHAARLPARRHAAQTSYKPYLSLSGTSMAAPVVAGTVALMLEANPTLTPNAVKAILQYTAQVTRGDSMPRAGRGPAECPRRRPAGAVLRVTARPASARWPTASPANGSPWARHIIWGNYRVTGGMPLPGSNAWATSVRWGALRRRPARASSGARGDDNIVWSTGAATTTSSGAPAATTTSSGAPAARRQHRLEHGRRRQHRLEHGAATTTSSGARADDNIVWSTADDNIVWSTGRRRQHRLEHRRRRQHRLEHRARCRTSSGAPTAAAQLPEGRLGRAAERHRVGHRVRRRQHRLEHRRRRQHRLEHR